MLEYINHPSGGVYLCNIYVEMNKINDGDNGNAHPPAAKEGRMRN